MRSLAEWSGLAAVLGARSGRAAPSPEPSPTLCQPRPLACPARPQPSVRLLKHIIRCYLRLSDNPRAREALRQCLPDLLRNTQFTACLKDDLTTRRWAGGWVGG